MGVVFQQIVVSRNPLFEMLPPIPVDMRRKWNAVLLFFVLSAALASPLVSVSSARSVHETSDYDLFPQGDFTDASQWTVGATTSFTSQPADYTESMVADQRMTMVHQRPQNGHFVLLESQQSFRIGQCCRCARWSLHVVFRTDYERPRF